MSKRLIIATAVLGAVMAGCQTTPEPVQLTAGDYYNQGLDAFDQGDYSAATLDFEQAVSMDRDFGAAYCKLGEARDKLGRKESAMDAYVDCLELKPTNGMAHARLGELYMAERQYAKAQAHLERAVEYLPTDAMAHYSLAEIYRKQGKCSAPLKLYQKALDLQSDLVDAKEGQRNTRRNNCKSSSRPRIQKESEFTGGGKALKPSQW